MKQATLSASPGPSTSIGTFVRATRPAFATASIAPVLAGTALGCRIAGSLDLRSAALALVATVCVHLASNVLNDVGDDLGGTDAINTGRISPFTGGSRMIQDGLLNRAQMIALASRLMVAALLTGLALAWLKGPGVLAFGVAGVLLGLLYSLPPVQLVSRGVGELVIALAFGVVPVLGAAWLQGASVGGAAVWIAIPIGTWTAAILLINEVPDCPADAATGKRTWVVCFGVNATRLFYLGLHGAAALALGAGVALRSLPPATLAGLIALPLGFKAAQAIHAPLQRDALLTGIRSTLAAHLLGSIGVLCGLILG